MVQSLAVAFLATVLTASLAPGLASRMEQYQQQAPPAATQPGANAGTSTAATGTEGRPALCNLPNSNLPLPAIAQSDISTFCQGYIVGFGRAYQWTFYAALLALLLGAFLPGWPFHWEGRENVAGGAQPAVAAGHD
ncbi:MAG: hypothetical protein R2867_11240 [Caldilineaceae bacterium]